jgi:aspartate dehydrogenase
MRTRLTVAVAGLGAVGLPVAEALLQGRLQGLQLSAVSASSPQSAASKLAHLGSHPVPCLPTKQLAERADVVVEALPPSEFAEVAGPALSAGKTLIALSVTQVLRNQDWLQRLTRDHGGRVLIPTGALCGLDAVRAATEGGHVRSVVMQTRKPPASLQNAPFVKEQGLDLFGLQEPMRLYAGSVNDAAERFPANVNVAVALALAGIGPEATQYELWADPNVERNTHSFSVLSDESDFQVQVAGVPSATNPATGALTPLSTIATLRGLVAPLRVGT